MLWTFHIHLSSKNTIQDLCKAHFRFFKTFLKTITTQISMNQEYPYLMLVDKHVRGFQLEQAFVAPDDSKCVFLSSKRRSETTSLPILQFTSLEIWVGQMQQCCTVSRLRSSSLYSYCRETCECRGTLRVSIYPVVADVHTVKWCLTNLWGHVMGRNLTQGFSHYFNCQMGYLLFCQSLFQFLKNKSVGCNILLWVLLMLHLTNSIHGPWTLWSGKVSSLFSADLRVSFGPHAQRRLSALLLLSGLKWSHSQLSQSCLLVALVHDPERGLLLWVTLALALSYYNSAWYGRKPSAQERTVSSETYLPIHTTNTADKATLQQTFTAVALSLKSSWKINSQFSSFLSWWRHSCHVVISLSSHVFAHRVLLCLWLCWRSGPNGDVVCQVFSEYVRACAHADHPLHDWRQRIPQCGTFLQVF